jgi:hypothetical protein
MVGSRFQQQGSGDSTGALDSLDSLRQQVEQLEYEVRVLPIVCVLILKTTGLYTCVLCVPA